MAWLAAPHDKILCCKGAIMKDILESELGCYETSFLPKHKGGLANEFRCFINYSSEYLSF